MKSTSFLRRMAPMALAIVVVVGVTPVFASNQPIPGIDVVVKKKPSGTAIATVISDDKGQFVLSGLKAGSYELRFADAVAKDPREATSAQGAAKASINTSRSNIKTGKPQPANAPIVTSRSNKKQALVSAWDHHIVVGVALQGDAAMDDEPIVVEIPKDGMALKGRIVRADTDADVKEFFRIEGHLGKADR